MSDAGNYMDGESNYLDGWLQRRILRQVEQMLPALFEKEAARRATTTAELIAQGVCVCQTCGSVLTRHNIGKPKRETTVAETVDMVAAEFGVTPRDILSARRERTFTEPRQVAMWLAIKATPASKSLVARVFSRHHATVIHAVKVVERRMIANVDFAANVARLRKQIEAVAIVLPEAAE